MCLSCWFHRLHRANSLVYQSAGSRACRDVGRASAIYRHLLHMPLYDITHSSRDVQLALSPAPFFYLSVVRSFVREQCRYEQVAQCQCSFFFFCFVLFPIDLFRILLLAAQQFDSLDISNIGLPCSSRPVHSNIVSLSRYSSLEKYIEEEWRTRNTHVFID